MLGSLIQEGKGAYRMLEESPYKSELGIAFKKELTKNWQKSLQKRLQRCKVKGLQKNSYKIRIGCGRNSAGRRK